MRKIQYERGNIMIYVVKRGDTLSQLARDFGTSVSRLRSDNGLLADQPLVPGQALV
ncbi:MAG: LysM peptidoglycan-binding domain-containing protein, partial [Ruminiclostridium sp.]|nr:LysM peptidoglycan-binding domain-containing protein [Ruminiclostridium sp.]